MYNKGSEGQLLLLLLLISREEFYNAENKTVSKIFVLQKVVTCFGLVRRKKSDRKKWRVICDGMEECNVLD